MAPNILHLWPKDRGSHSFELDVSATLSKNYDELVAIFYIDSLNQVCCFLNKKGTQFSSQIIGGNSAGVRVGHGWATAQGAGYKGALAH